MLYNQFVLHHAFNLPIELLWNERCLAIGTVRTILGVLFVRIAIQELQLPLESKLVIQALYAHHRLTIPAFVHAVRIQALATATEGAPLFALHLLGGNPGGAPGCLLHVAVDVL